MADPVTLAIIGSLAGGAAGGFSAGGKPGHWIGPALGGAALGAGGGYFGGPALAGLLGGAGGAAPEAFEMGLPGGGLAQSFGAAPAGALGGGGLLSSLLGTSGGAQMTPDSAKLASTALGQLGGGNTADAQLAAQLARLLPVGTPSYGPPRTPRAAATPFSVSRFLR